MFKVIIFAVGVAVGMVGWSMYGNQLSEKTQTVQSEVQSEAHEQAQNIADALEQ